MRKIFDYLKLLRKYNTLENKYETLVQDVKSELYKDFMAKLGEPLEMKRLRKENAKFRRQIKELKGRS